MEIEYRAAQDKAAAQEQAAREREPLEHSHNAEIKALYQKMSAYQNQIAELTKTGKQPTKASTSSKQPKEKAKAAEMK